MQLPCALSNRNPKIEKKKEKELYQKHFFIFSEKLYPKNLLE